MRKVGAGCQPRMALYQLGFYRNSCSRKTSRTVELLGLRDALRVAAILVSRVVFPMQQCDRDFGLPRKPSLFRIAMSR